MDSRSAPWGAVETPSRSRPRILDFYMLTKPSITLLVVVTVLPSMLLATSYFPSPLLILCCMVGTALTSASAAVFNQLVEAESDGVMQRTSVRALPAGRVQSEQAFAFGVLLGVLGLFLLYAGVNPLSAEIAAFGHIFYVLIYTIILKKRTAQNIVIGGAAGAVGPLIGWAAVSNNLEWPAWVLFGLIFFWTPPHFWSLSLKYRDDYARANIPMHPVVYGIEQTKRAIFGYSVILLPLSLSLYVFDVAGWIYALGTSALSLKFAVDAYLLWRSKGIERAMPLFFFSCFYVLGVFGFLLMDSLILR